MERFYEQTIFKYLRCEPEDHYFLLVSINVGITTPVFNIVNSIPSSHFAIFDISECYRNYECTGQGIPNENTVGCSSTGFNVMCHTTSTYNGKLHCC